MSFKPLELDDLMPFGKYQGCAMSEICEETPWYITWLAKNTDVNLCESVVEAAELRTAEQKRRKR